jgi:hypothetical protein
MTKWMWRSAMVSKIGSSRVPVAGDTVLKAVGMEVGHFTNLSAASLNNQGSFAGLLA